MFFILVLVFLSLKSVFAFNYHRSFLNNREIGYQKGLHQRSMIKETTQLVSQTNDKSAHTLIGESAKFVVSGIAGTIIISQPTSWKPIYYVFMGVINGLLSKILKSIIKMPRPPNSSEDGYGMPSSHTQSIVYFWSVLYNLLIQQPTYTNICLLTIISVYGIAAR